MKFFSALIFPFRDRTGVLKLLLAIGMAAIPFLGFFLIKGWEYEISVKVRRGHEEVPGFRKPVQLLQRGLLLRATGFIFNLPMYAMLALFFVSSVGVLIAVFSTGLNSEVTRQEFNRVFLGSFGLWLAILLGALVANIVGSFLFSTGYIFYIETGKYASFYRLHQSLSKAFEFPWDDIWQEVFTTVAKGLAALLASGLSTLLGSTGVGLIVAPVVVPALVLAFMSWTTGHWQGQLAARTFDRGRPITK